MEWLFGRKKTPEEMLRQNQRALNKAMRDLDRERQKMEQQEKKVIADIKKMAKQGQMVSLFLPLSLDSHNKMLAKCIIYMYNFFYWVYLTMRPLSQFCMQ